MKALLSKIRTNGWRWTLARIKRELRHPTHPTTRKWIDSALSVRSRVAHLYSPPKSVEYLYCIYDLEINAITFNLVQFLIEAELEAKKSEKRGFVLVLVPPVQKSLLTWKEYDRVHDRFSKEWRINNILLPLASLSLACKGVYLLASRDQVVDLIRGVEVHPRLYDGKNLRGLDDFALHDRLSREGLGDGLRAPAQATRYIEEWKSAMRVTTPIVTITLRTQKFDPARNSNLDEWEKFARYLDSSGFLPVIIPDTDQALQRQAGFDNMTVFSECSWNLGLRMALYEVALVNFFVPNGCSALAMYSRNIRYIMMNMLPKGSIVATLEAYDSWGQEIGKNVPFAGPGQILCYEPDICENMILEFQRFLSTNDIGAWN